MAPQMAQFESKFQDKANIIDIDLDNKDSPDFKKYEALMRRSDSIPYTVWIDKSGKVLDDAKEVLNADELATKTQKFLH